LQLFFSATLLLSAALLFVVEPMIGKMVLPLLGGTPSVWNTCMVFFQAALLAGYSYAHALPNWLGVRRHAALHLVLLLLPFLVLPLALPPNWTPPESSSPILWLLELLAVMVGLPFFMLATNASLVQLWFAGTGHAFSKDPYFLYSASNLGSLLGLLSYPVLIEPNLSIATQTWAWTIGYGILVLMMFGCAVVLWRAPDIRGQRTEDKGQSIDPKDPRTENGKRDTRSTTSQPASSQPHHPTTSPLTAHYSLLTTRPILTRLHWLALAFVPSSLMLSVTTFMTTDIAAIPLLWVIPLALYLLSFILVFARKPLLPHAVMARISPLAVIALVVVILTQATEPISVLLALHLLTFFVIAMVCHGELAKRRPPVEYLTEFYLWLAVGGVLGGIFNALVAPLAFKAVLEYPLVLVFACLLRPKWSSPETGRLAAKDKRKIGTRAAKPPATPVPAEPASPLRKWILRPITLDVILPLLLGLGTAAVVVMVQASLPGHDSIRVALMFMPGAVLCYTFLDRPTRFGLGIAALFLASTFYIGAYAGKVIYRDRSFFGVHRIMSFPLTLGSVMHSLVHGNTVHGRENMGHPDVPLSYYHSNGPIGQVFASAPAASGKNIAIVGLGAGALATYGKEGQHFTFYEIDPAVVHIARDSGHFTFLEHSHADLDFVLGDARLTLKKSPDRQYDMIILDAFSSDSIPLHLMTREAVDLYKSKLSDNGLLIFHVSSRYLDLLPVLGDLADDAGLVCWARNQREVTEVDLQQGKSGSTWLVMAHSRADLGKLRTEEGWEPVPSRLGRRVWTDDYSNLFSVFQWK
jgi:hypothetical protein